MRPSLDQRHEILDGYIWNSESRACAVTTMRPSLCQSHEVLDWWVHLELSLSSHDVLACCLACHATEDNAVQERVTAKTVVAMNSSSNLTSSIHSWNHFSFAVNALSICCDLKATHTVVDHRCDDGYVEGLSGHCRAWDDVVVEFLAAAGWATGCIP